MAHVRPVVMCLRMALPSDVAHSSRVELTQDMLMVAPCASLDHLSWLALRVSCALREPNATQTGRISNRLGFLALPQNSVAFAKRGSHLTSRLLAVVCSEAMGSMPDSPEVVCGPKFRRTSPNRLSFSATSAVPRETLLANRFRLPPPLSAWGFGTCFFPASFSNRGSLIAILYLVTACIAATGLTPLHPEVVCAPKPRRSATRVVFSCARFRHPKRDEYVAVAPCQGHIPPAAF
jgi:hypothetical protein